MRPTPSPSVPKISEVFTSEKVVRDVSHEKDGKLGALYQRWDDYKNHLAGRGARSPSKFAGRRDTFQQGVRYA